MHITIEENDQITITGAPRTHEENLEVQEIISGQIENGKKAIEINLPDSSFLTSSVIGYFLMIHEKHQAEIKIHYKNPEFEKLIKSLKLDHVIRLSRMA